jgi:hypothetical protein
MNWKRNLLKAVFGSVVLVGSLALLSVPAQADCYSSLRNKRFDLEKAIDRHGAWSSQAAHERNELRQQELKCGYGSGYGRGYGYGYDVPVYRDRDDRYRGDRDNRYVDRERDDRRGRDRNHDRGRDRDGDRDRDQDRH